MSVAALVLGSPTTARHPDVPTARQDGKKQEHKLHKGGGRQEALKFHRMAQIQVQVHFRQHQSHSSRRFLAKAEKLGPKSMQKPWPEPNYEVLTNLFKFAGHPARHPVGTCWDVLGLGTAITSHVATSLRSCANLFLFNQQQGPGNSYCHPLLLPPVVAVARLFV